MNKCSGIYRITCTATDTVYVGSAKNFNKRWTLHRGMARDGRHHSRYFQRAWDKYGSEAFAFDVLEVVASTEDLISREQFWINTLRPAFNVCPNAGSPLGVKHTDETRAKYSAAHKGKRLTEETKRKLSEALKGRVYTPESKARRSETLKGRVFSEETRKKCQ